MDSDRGGRCPHCAPDVEHLTTLMPHFVRMIELGVIKLPQIREILRTVFNLKMIEEPELIEEEKGQQLVKEQA